jgi:hypothetical protein
MSVGLNTNANVQNLSTNAADLQGTTPVGNQPNADGSTNLPAGTNSEDPRNLTRNSLNFTPPASTGAVTTGNIDPRTGVTPGTVTNGPVTATTSRPLGAAQPNVTGVSATGTLAPGVTGTVGVTPANGGTLTGGVTATGNLGNNVRGTVGVSGTQPISGAPGTVTGSASVQSGGTTVRGSVTSAPNGTSGQIGVTQQIGNSGQIGATANITPTGTTVGINGSYQVNPNLNVTGGVTVSPTETVGRVGVGFSF